MRKLSSFLLTLVLVISSSVVFAQQGATLKGKVLDENGDPLPGASVFIEASELGALKTYGLAADQNGDYEFSVDAKYANGQEVDLQVRYVGYKTAIAKITLRVGTVTQNFNMTLDNLMLDEIVVTGVISGTPKKKLAFNVAKVNKEAL
jgi:outer membrane receptor for ferrienterochelin and colicins